MPNLSDLISSNATAVASAGGTWSEISETTISSSTSAVEFTSLSNTYKHFKLRFNNILSGPGTIYFRFMNGSSVINSSSYHTHNIAQRHNTGAIYYSSTGAQNTGYLFYQYTHDGFYPSNGEIDIFLTSINPMAVSKMQYHKNGGIFVSEQNAIVYFQNSGTIDGFKVQQTQNFTGGTMKLYGLA